MHVVSSAKRVKDEPLAPTIHRKIEDILKIVVAQTLFLHLILHSKYPHR